MPVVGLHEKAAATRNGEMHADNQHQYPPPDEFDDLIKARMRYARCSDSRVTFWINSFVAILCLNLVAVCSVLVMHHCKNLHHILVMLKMET
jgi:predicted anti-sigma-YlaC factor YlaD